MARFVGIPEVPMQQDAEWMGQVLNALKQNVELLAGIRGEADRASAAVTRGQVRTVGVGNPAYTRPPELTAQGAGVTISSQQVPLLSDYGALIGDVRQLAVNMQLLANDVAELRSVVNSLLTELRQ